MASYFLPPNTPDGGDGYQTCFAEAALETPSGARQLVYPGDTITLRVRINDTIIAAGQGNCVNSMKRWTCSRAESCLINGFTMEDRTLTPNNPSYFEPTKVLPLQATHWQMATNQTNPQGVYEAVFKISPTETTLGFNPPNQRRGAWVGLHTSPRSAGAAASARDWSYHIPFNIVPDPLKPGERDKVRKELSLQWPNPFGDTFCLECILGRWVTVWRSGDRNSSPKSMGYGWNLDGHDLTLERVPNPDLNENDPNYELNKDIVIRDGSGVFERWKGEIDPTTGSYPPRYQNNFAILTMNAIDGTWTVVQKDKTTLHFAMFDVPGQPGQQVGRLVSQKDRNDLTTTYERESAEGPKKGRLTRMSDGEGRSLTYRYFDHPSASNIRQDDGQIYQILDQDNVALVTFGYYPENGPNAGRLHTITNAAGEVTTTEYYPETESHLKGRVLRQRDARGKVKVEYEYYLNGKVRTETRYNERRFTYTYEGSGPYDLTVKDEELNAEGVAINARTSRYEYNDYLRLVRFVDPLNNEYRWEYNDTDENNNPRNPYLMTKSIDPNGAETLQEFDASANLIQLENAQGAVYTMAYQDGYLLKEVQRPPVEVNGVPVTYPPTKMDYDLKGNLTAIKDDLDGITYSTVFAHDTSGRVTQITDRLGNTSTMSYTTTQSATQNKGNLATLTLPEDLPKNDPARILSWTYDKRDNSTSQQDAAGNTIARQFDQNQRVTKLTDALGKFINYNYADGLLESVTLPSLQDATNSGNRRKTRFTFDEPGRVKEVLSQRSPTEEEMRVKHVYDGRSNLKELIRLQQSIQPPEENIPSHKFEVDELDRPTKHTNPLGNVSDISWDPHCKNYRTTSSRGVLIEVCRDSLCRITRIESPTEIRELEYDSLDRLIKLTQTDKSRYGKARFGQARYPQVEVTLFEYDAWDRLVKMTLPGNQVIRYERDAEDRITKITDNLGNVTEYSYYNDGKLYRVTCSGQMFEYRYENPSGRLRQIIYPSSTGIVAKFYLEDPTEPPTEISGWDANGRLLHLRYMRTVNNVEGLLQRFSYTYDDSGNRKTMTETSPNGTVTNWSFRYDWFNRLTEVYKNGQVQSRYAYDGRDNRTEHKIGDGVNLVTMTYEHDVADRITSTTRNGQLFESYSHDVDGNMTSRVKPDEQPTTYTWSDFNKLIGVKVPALGQNPAISETYGYDAEGIRKSKNNDTRYYSSGGASLSDLLPINSISFIQADQIRGMRYQSNFFWYIPDALGTVRLVVDSSGQVVSTLEVDEFGRKVDSTGSSPRPHGFVGSLGVRDESHLGLSYMRQRWYDPSLGSFLSEDPIGFRGGLNLYSYVGNNPVGRVDPSGLVPEPLQQRFLPVKQFAIEQRERAVAGEITGLAAMQAVTNKIDSIALNNDEFLAMMQAVFIPNGVVPSGARSCRMSSLKNSSLQDETGGWLNGRIKSQVFSFPVTGWAPRHHDDERELEDQAHHLVAFLIEGYYNSTQGAYQAAYEKDHPDKAPRDYNLAITGIVFGQELHNYGENRKIWLNLIFSTLKK